MARGRCFIKSVSEIEGREGAPVSETLNETLEGLEQLGLSEMMASPHTVSSQEDCHHENIHMAELAGGQSYAAHK